MQAFWRLLTQQQAPIQCCAQGSAEPGSGPEKLLRGTNCMAQIAWHLGLRLLLEEPVSPPTTWTGGSSPGTPPRTLRDRATAGCASSHACSHVCACTLMHTHTLPHVHTHTDSRSRPTQGSGVRPPRDMAAHTRFTRGRGEGASLGGAASLRQGGSCQHPRVTAGAVGTPEPEGRRRGPAGKSPGLGAGHPAPATSATSSTLHTHGHGQNGSKRGTGLPLWGPLQC